MDTVFDTLAYAKKLENAGVDRKQAEVQAEALKEFGEIRDKKAYAELATKADLRESELRIELKMRDMEGRIRNWVIGTMLALAALFIGGAGLIISYLPK